MRQIRRFRFFTPRLFGDCGASLSIHASNSRCDFESSHGWHARTMLPNTVAPFLITGTTWSQRRTSRLPQKAQRGSGSQRLKYSTTSCFSLTPNCRSRRQSRSNLSRYEKPTAGVVLPGTLGSSMAATPASGPVNCDENVLGAARSEVPETGTPGTLLDV